MSEERPFEVVDRRRVRAESEASEESAGESAPDAGVEDVPEEEITAEANAPEPDDAEVEDEGEPEVSGTGGQPMMQLDVATLLRVTVGLLNEKAWVALGLLADPVTGTVGPDLAEARRAIDVLTDLVKHLEPISEPEEKRELQVMLSNLRVNFVRLS